MAKKQIKRQTYQAADAYSIANAQGEPWTWQCWHLEQEAEIYLSKWQRDAGIKLPKHRVVPVRASVRFTKATLAALSKRKTKS